jgi:peptide/nickel transport system substrate-binding protein
LSAEASRRRFLAGSIAAAFVAAKGGAAHARGRVPVGGRIALRVPFPVASIDPHRLDDPIAAIFGEAVFDTLYARDETGGFVPALAESEPEPDGNTLRVKLRSGVRTAKGRPFEPRDAWSSLARARAGGAKAWLADVPAPRIDGRSLVFAMRDASRLVRALASPLAAMVPSTFAADAPDGTGPFRWTPRGDAVALVRNPLAARGPAFLEEVVVRSGPAAASLRAFESGTDDIAWHGPGLYNKRTDAASWDLGAVGWAVLFTGRDAQSWDAPGVAQQVCDGIPPSRLAFLALGPAWTVDANQQGWGGPPAQILVREDAPWLVELATAIAATIKTPGHDVAVAPVSAVELAQRRASRAFTLALDVVRPVSHGSLGAMVALAAADNREAASQLVLHPPRLGDVGARTMTRTLRCGVVGEIRVQGARVSDLRLAPSSAAFGFDLGGSTRARAR